MTLDYAPVRFGPTTRYSVVVVISFVLALLLPLLVFRVGFPAIAVLPGWIMMGVPLLIFAINFLAAFRLLNAPNHILGDGLIASGVFISGMTSLIAMFFVLMVRL